MERKRFNLHMDDHRFAPRRRVLRRERLSCRGGIDYALKKHLPGQSGDRGSDPTGHFAPFHVLPTQRSTEIALPYCLAKRDRNGRCFRFRPSPWLGFPRLWRVMDRPISPLEPEMTSHPPRSLGILNLQKATFDGEPDASIATRLDLEFRHVRLSRHCEPVQGAWQSESFGGCDAGASRVCDRPRHGASFTASRPCAA